VRAVAAWWRGLGVVAGEVYELDAPLSQAVLALLSAVSPAAWRQLSRGLWAGLWYLLAYQVVGWVLFSIALTAVATGAMFSVTVVGVPLLITAAAIVRWCADVERARLRPLGGEVVGGYREPADSDGMVARLRVRWQDPALWRDLAYLLGLFIPLVLLGLVVLTVWGVLLAGITMPIWYWAPFQSINGVRYHGAQLGYFPNG